MFLENYIKACETIELIINNILLDNDDHRHRRCNNIDIDKKGKIKITVSEKISEEDAGELEDLFYEYLGDPNDGWEPKFEIVKEGKGEEV